MRAKSQPLLHTALKKATAVTERVHRVPFRWGSHSFDACSWDHFTKRERLVLILSPPTHQAPGPKRGAVWAWGRNSLKWGQCLIVGREMSLTASCWTYFPFTAVMDFPPKASPLWAERLPVGIFLTASQGSFCFCCVWDPSTHAHMGTPGVRGWSSPEKGPTEGVGERLSQRRLFLHQMLVGKMSGNLKFQDDMEVEIQKDILNLPKDQPLYMVLRRPEVDMVRLSSSCLGGVFCAVWIYWLSSMSTSKCIKCWMCVLRLCLLSYHFHITKTWNLYIYLQNGAKTHQILEVSDFTSEAGLIP